MAPGSITKATGTTLGTPGMACVKKMLLGAMVTPARGTPGRPTEIFVAHRWVEGWVETSGHALLVGVLYLLPQV
jgi:hypothetical protein